MTSDSKGRKLLVCDVEGTIFTATFRIPGTEYASTMWQPIAKALGPAALEEEKATHAKWKRGDYGGKYLDWVRDTIEIHKKYGLDEDTFYDLINSAEYADGVEAFFKNLDRDEYIPVLVSGGFQNLIRRAQRDLGIEHGYGACDYIFGADGLLYAYNLVECDFEGKFKYIDWLFDHYSIDFMHDWIFIGDGLNDVDIAEHAPLSFGVNAHKELKKAVTYEVESFREISRYLAEGIEDEPWRAQRSRDPNWRGILIPSATKHRRELESRVREVEAENRRLHALLQRDRGPEARSLQTVAVTDADYTTIPSMGSGKYSTISALSSLDYERPIRLFKR